jgi:hypothetical protein
MLILNIEIISVFYIKIILEIVPLKQSLKLSAFKLWNFQDDMFIKKLIFVMASEFCKRNAFSCT